MDEVKTVKTICALCTNHCGIDVQVQNGQILKVSGMQRTFPFHHLCVKPYALQELAYSKERVTTPLVKHKGTFKEISWEDAFDIIANKLTKIKNQYGAKAIVPFCGNGFACRSNGKVIGVLRIFWEPPTILPGDGRVFPAPVIAFTLTVGGFPNPGFCRKNKCMILWGQTLRKALRLKKSRLKKG